MNTTAVRALFSISVAVTAAAAADPLVEYASNLGLFGRGAFTDHSNLDVLPALGIAVLFIIFQALMRAQNALRTDCARRMARLLRAANRAISDRASIRLLPATFATQILVLFTMETLEQFAVAGHGLGGVIWLGGPVAISLACHVLSCLITTSVVACTIHALARAAVRIACIFRAMTLLAIDALAPLLGAFDDTTIAHRLTPSLYRFGERAPPSLVR